MFTLYANVFYIKLFFSWPRSLVLFFLMSHVNSLKTIIHKFYHFYDQFRCKFCSKKNHDITCFPFFFIHEFNQTNFNFPHFLEPNKGRLIMLFSFLWFNFPCFLLFPLVVIDIVSFFQYKILFLSWHRICSMGIWYNCLNLIIAMCYVAVRVIYFLTF